MAEKIHDREMYKIRLINLIQCYSDHKNKDRLYKVKYINDIIQDLERYGPAGLIHIAILSSIRPIKIWSGILNKIIGEKKTRHTVDIEYHATDSEGIGHWTLRGGKDPDNVVIDLNSCLFAVIGSQIGQDPLKLRKWTVLKLKSNFQNLTKWIDQIKLKRNNKMILMIGGARYKGKGPQEAKKILDQSQGKSFHEGWYKRGHSRGHASDPSSSGQTIETYSIGASKSGFLSPADQDYVIDLALRTKIAQNAMKKLNEGSIKEVIYIAAASLKNPEESKELEEPYELPKVKEWVNGKERICSEGNMEGVTLVLCHRYGMFGKPEEDVFIETCFPCLEKKLIKSLI